MPLHMIVPDLEALLAMDPAEVGGVVLEVLHEGARPAAQLLRRLSQHARRTTGNRHTGGIVRRRVGRPSPTAECGASGAARTSVNTRP